MMSTIPVRSTPGPRQEESLEEQFRRLATEWDKATAYLSSMSEASKHPAYQAVICLGHAVVPFLLRDMEENHTHWFIALGEITGANPVSETAAGNIPKMVDAWLDWARVNGYQW